ncbi:MAG: aspartate--tRNA ligase [Armatimonadetes bacterium]|nr:aspartate--tRNA ligase [Armatimonadota bacterium]
MSFQQRTHDCGALRPQHEGQAVVINGWAHRVRDLGGLFFVDVRDRTGIVQAFFDPAKFSNLAEIRSETCLSIQGALRHRSPETVNPKMATGEVELVVESYQVLGPAKPIPFPVSDEEQMVSVNEELRIKHRYLDLRRPSMYRKLAVRAGVVTGIRKYLDERGFVETETPIITRSTPEGARDYLVPYRLDPGKFYALPQSPQQYKQLLMVAGLERYYQICKCFRDESQRADRQPEFTQLDLEMSFVTQEDVLQVAEGLLREVCNDVIAKFGLEKDPVEPFARLTYAESMERFGCDKPDLRFGLELFDITDAVKGSEFGVFKSVAASGGKIRGVRYPGGASLSRKDVGDLETMAKEWGAKGLATLWVADGEGALSAPCGLKVRGSIAKFFKPEELDAILKVGHAEDGDLLCFAADTFEAGNNVLFRLRNEIGSRCGLRDKRKLVFCWVLDFPLFERDEETGRWSPSHHPFTSPKFEHLDRLESDPGSVLADCYDVVCNGTEMASGSIRIHRPDIQSRVFSLLNIDEPTQKDRFGHMLEAFQFGAPPHGGIAPGIDRIVMHLLDEENIREVMAFPKIGPGLDPMMGAPSEVDEAQWVEMGLQLRPRK